MFFDPTDRSYQCCHPNPLAGPIVGQLFEMVKRDGDGALEARLGRKSSGRGPFSVDAYLGTAGDFDESDLADVRHCIENH